MYNLNRHTRRLRFDRDLADDESIPGAIAKGVREHVLERTNLVLEAAEVPLKHLGWSQLCDHEELARLAFVARCEPAFLIARAGERVLNDQAKISVDARFGTLVIPRAYLELNRRRIAPVTLRKHNYHRLGWMNLLLPYCTESLERLVSSCSHCRATLKWHYAWGIESCDICQRVVDPAQEPLLAEELAPNYRLFSQIVSLRVSAATAALDRLPATLRTVQRGTLVRLALQLGGIVQKEMVETTSRQAVARLPGPVLASIVASGTGMLSTWPDGFRTWVSNQARELEADPSALQVLRTKLKRLTSQDREKADLVSLVRDALPDLGRHHVHSFPTDKRYYIYQQVRDRLGTSPEQTEVLRSVAEDKFRSSNKRTNHQGRFDAEFIDLLEPHFRNTMSFSSCAWQFQLPIYAIDQLCAPDLLEWEDHPIVLATRPRRHVREASVAELCRKLKASAELDLPPQRAVSLATASKRIGGRLKPWSCMIDALRMRQLPFWLAGPEPTSKSIVILPEDLKRFDQVEAQLPTVGLEHAETLSQLDAGQILNITPALVAKRSGDFKLSFKREGLALVASREDVLAIAGEIAWSAEIALHLSISIMKVHGALKARNAVRFRTGWCRRDLIERGILPQPPQALTSSIRRGTIKG